MYLCKRYNGDPLDFSIMFGCVIGVGVIVIVYLFLVFNQTGNKETKGTKLINGTIPFISKDALLVVVLLFCVSIFVFINFYCNFGWEFVFKGQEFVGAAFSFPDRPVACG